MLNFLPQDANQATIVEQCGEGYRKYYLWLGSYQDWTSFTDTWKMATDAQHSRETAARSALKDSLATLPVLAT